MTELLATKSSEHVVSGFPPDDPSRTAKPSKAWSSLDDALSHPRTLGFYNKNLTLTAHRLAHPPIVCVAVQGSGLDTLTHFRAQPTRLVPSSLPIYGSMAAVAVLAVAAVLSLQCDLAFAIHRSV
jgi:hypothetical protein